MKAKLLLTAMVTVMAIVPQAANAVTPWQSIDHTDPITDERQVVYIKSSDDYTAFGEYGTNGAFMMIGCGIGQAVGFKEADLSGVRFNKGGVTQVTYRIDNRPPVTTYTQTGYDTVAVPGMLPAVMSAEKKIVVRYTGDALDNTVTRTYRVSNRDRIVRMKCNAR